MPGMTPREAFAEALVANEVNTMFGIMGSEFPTMIGAKVSSPDHPAIAYAGDSA